jgi:uncharacterized protein (DUF1501 family)
MITRRLILRALGTAPLMPGLAFADIPHAASQQKIFILIILRGAMDGLAAVPPLGDPDYARLRKNLALGTVTAPNGCLKLDSKFFLHPALAPVMPLYTQGDFLILHAMASPYRDRSHFDAQNILETGCLRPGMSDQGWLNHTLTALGAREIMGIAFTPEMPLVLTGPAPVANWQPGGGKSDLIETVAKLYESDPALSMALQGAQKTNGEIEAATGGTAKTRDFKTLCNAAGKTLAAEDGPRLAVLEIGGWDTHVAQGTKTGRLANALTQLAAGMVALQQSLGPAWRDTAALAITEFGRTAHPNGTGGTDHGTATAGFLFGGAVAGGRVQTDWPGLNDAALYQKRDLAPTLDLRGVIKAILGDHLGITRVALDQKIFPGSAALKPQPGLMRGVG